VKMNRVIEKLTRAVGVRAVRQEDAVRVERHGTEINGRRDAHARSLSDRFASLLGLVD